MVNILFYFIYDLFDDCSVKLMFYEVPYASHFTFELYDDAPREPYVKVMFNNKDVSILGCDIVCRASQFTKCVPFSNDLRNFMGLIFS
jgi:hypothetical protein